MLRPQINLAKNILASNVRTPVRPYKATIAVTYRCNSRCTTCDIWKRQSTDGMTTADYQTLFKNNPYLAWIDLTGGEVFLREDIVDICASAIESCPGLYMLHFPTNGLLTDRIVDRVLKILALNPNRLIVSISIDGPREIHDKIRGANGFFDKTLATFKNLRALRNKRFQVFPGMTLSSDNLGKIGGTVDAIRKAVPDFSEEELHVNIAHTSEHFYGNSGMDLSFRSEALKEIQAFSKAKGKKLDGIHMLEHAYLKLAEKYVETGKTPLPCMALSASCFIDPTATVYPCGMENSPVGTLSDYGYNLQRLWASDKAVAIRNRIAKGQCQQCWTPCEAYQTLFSRLITVVGCNMFS